MQDRISMLLSSRQLFKNREREREKKLVSSPKREWKRKKGRWMDGRTHSQKFGSFRESIVQTLYARHRAYLDIDKDDRGRERARCIRLLKTWTKVYIVLVFFYRFQTKRYVLSIERLLIILQSPYFRLFNRVDSCSMETILL